MRTAIVVFSSAWIIAGALLWGYGLRITEPSLVGLGGMCCGIGMASFSFLFGMGSNK